jgi:hypothetical protein
LIPRAEKGEKERDKGLHILKTESERWIKRACCCYIPSPSCAVCCVRNQIWTRKSLVTRYLYFFEFLFSVSPAVGRFLFYNKKMKRRYNPKRPKQTRHSILCDPGQ